MLTRVKAVREGGGLGEPPMSTDQLKPEERVRITISMTDVVVRICADGIRDRNPTITEEELISILRRRLRLGRRLPPRGKETGDSLRVDTDNEATW